MDPEMLWTEKHNKTCGKFVGDAENARFENTGNTEYGKPRLYKHVTMYMTFCSAFR